MSTVTVQKLIDVWPEIRSIIAEISLKEDLFCLYKKVGIKTSLADIEIPENRTNLLLEYSPTVRNRMTLMRIKRMLAL